MRTNEDGTVEQTFIMVAKVAAIDTDLLDQVPAIIRSRFSPTAIRIIECEPEVAGLDEMQTPDPNRDIDPAEEARRSQAEIDSQGLDGPWWEYR